MDFIMRKANEVERFEIKKHVIEFLKEGTAGQVNPESISPDVIEMMNKLFDTGLETLVAINEGSWIGYIVYTADQKNPLTGDKEGFILELYVNSEYRKKGIAKALVMECMKQIKTKGRTTIGLNVFASNRKARKLYESLGFCEFTTVMKSKIL